MNNYISIKVKSKMRVEADIDQLEKDIYELFNAKLIVVVNAEIEVNTFMNTHKDTHFDYQVPFSLIKEIIENLKNNKCIGFDGISNEMLKYSNNYPQQKITQLIISKMLKIGHIPKGFNTSIIESIIKDPKKSRVQLSNVRTISISNINPAILERVLHYEMVALFKLHDKQMGFKANCSCAHAIFVVMEAIKSSKRSNLSTYLCSIYATKVFDKVERNLLYK
jgi:hypothetical protein